MDATTAMMQRRSTRVFLDKPVARKDLEEIFDCAGRAPSAINMQPWEYVVTYGDEKDRLVRKIQKARAERRVACGPGTEALLPNLFIRRAREAADAMKPAVAETGKGFNDYVEEGSCSFYGAPIAIVVTVDKRFGQERQLDLGLSVAYLFLAAEAKGLGTCPIGLISAYGDEISRALDIPREKQVVLGIALGHPDPDASLNRLRTPRAARSEILTWYE